MRSLRTRFLRVAALFGAVALFAAPSAAQEMVIETDLLALPPVVREAVAFDPRSERRSSEETGGALESEFAYWLRGGARGAQQTRHVLFSSFERGDFQLVHRYDVRLGVAEVSGIHAVRDGRLERAELNVDLGRTDFAFHSAGPGHLAPSIAFPGSKSLLVGRELSDETVLAGGVLLSPCGTGFGARIDSDAALDLSLTVQAAAGYDKECAPAPYYRAHVEGGEAYEFALESSFDGARGKSEIEGILQREFGPWRARLEVWSAWEEAGELGEPGQVGGPGGTGETGEPEELGQEAEARRTLQGILSLEGRFPAGSGSLGLEGDLRGLSGVRALGSWAMPAGEFLGRARWGAEDNEFAWAIGYWRSVTSSLRLGSTLSGGMSEWHQNELDISMRTPLGVMSAGLRVGPALGAPSASLKLTRQWETGSLRASVQAVQNRTIFDAEYAKIFGDVQFRVQGLDLLGSEPRFTLTMTYGLEFDLLPTFLDVRVVRPGDGGGAEPVPGVVVTLDWMRENRGVTGPDGRIRVNSISVGRHSLQISEVGLPGGWLPPESSRSLVVTPGRNEVVIELVRGSSLTVRVREAGSFLPIPGLSSLALRGLPVLVDGKTYLTRSDGTVEVTLPPGEHVIELPVDDLSGSYTVEGGQVRTVLLQAGGERNVEFVLKRIGDENFVEF